MTFLIDSLRIRWKDDLVPPVFCLHSPAHRFERFWVGDCARLVDFAEQRNPCFALSWNYPFLITAKAA